MLGVSGVGLPLDVVVKTIVVQRPPHGVHSAEGASI
jgi:hypothetical protein